MRRTREYVFAGDIFQANLSQRLDLLLRAAEPAPLRHAAHREPLAVRRLPALRRLRAHLARRPSASSRWTRDGWAETRPIAGTRPRGIAHPEDDALTDELNLDPKDRAEHIMLVDLERNDLGKVCEYGTVRVSELMVNEYYSHVIHIVSNVRGHLHPSRDAVDLVKAMFPGGTITGCPKVRCMEIVDELETVRRGPVHRLVRLDRRAARSTSTSSSARWCARATGCSCRPAAASSPTRCRRASTARRCTRPPACCAPSARASPSAPAERQPARRPTRAEQRRRCAEATGDRLRAVTMLILNGVLMTRGRGDPAGHRPRAHPRPRPLRDDQARRRRARLLRGARRPPRPRPRGARARASPSTGPSWPSRSAGSQRGQRRAPTAPAACWSRPGRRTAARRCSSRPTGATSRRGRCASSPTAACACSAQLKAMTVMQSYFAQRAAKAAGVDDAILVDDEGRIFEGATSNVFVVRGGGLVTPPAEGAILPGVLRAKVEELARPPASPSWRRARASPTCARTTACCSPAACAASSPVEQRRRRAAAGARAGADDAARAGRRRRGRERAGLPRDLPLEPRPMAARARRRSRRLPCVAIRGIIAPCSARPSSSSSSPPSRPRARRPRRRWTQSPRPAPTAARPDAGVARAASAGGTPAAARSSRRPRRWRSRSCRARSTSPCTSRPRPATRRASSWSRRRGAHPHRQGRRVLATPFLDLSGHGLQAAASRACSRWRSIPRYADQPAASTWTTRTSRGDTRVVRYRASATNPDVAVAVRASQGASARRPALLQPQRRAAAVRPGRPPLRGHGRRRQRRRPAGPRAGPAEPAGQAAAPQRQRLAGAG